MKSGHEMDDLPAALEFLIMQSAFKLDKKLPALLEN